jgi:hypothetical protein
MIAPKPNPEPAKRAREPEEPFTPGYRWQPPTFLRPIISTSDTFDQNTQLEDYSDVFATGRRPMWNTPRVAVLNEKVGTIKASAAVNSAYPSVATQSGAISGPSTTLTTFTVVPNMATVIRASGPVQISFAVNASTLNANDPGTFAVFRDGVQISQQYQGSAGAANVAFSVAASFTDNPPLGNHVYDVRWKQGASALTAVSTQRTIQVLNLRAQ